MNPPVPPSTLAIIGIVLFYTISAISMTLLNKSVLNHTPIPVTLMVCQSFVGWGLMRCLKIIGGKSGHGVPTWDRNVAKQLVPLVVISVLGLTANNYCLSHVDASFHQIARGLVLPCTVLCSIFILGQSPQPLSTFATLIVTIGFFSGVILDPHHNSFKAANPGGDVYAQGRTGTWKESLMSLGVVFGMASSVLSALHAIAIKTSLTAVNGSPLALAYYTNLLSGVLLLPLVWITGESGTVKEILISAVNEFGQGVWWGVGGRFVGGAVVTGVFGFLICLAVGLSIKVTSPVTHMISSAMRGVLQTIFSGLIFHDIIGTARLTSIMLIVLGSMLYVYAKTIESGFDARRERFVDLASPAVGTEEEEWTYDARDMRRKRSLLRV